MASVYERAMALLGFNIKKSDAASDNTPKTFIPNPPDGSFTLDTGGIVRYGLEQDIEQALKNEADLIRKYREVAKIPEANSAITDIVDQAIIMNEKQGPVSISTDNVEYPKRVKDAIQSEFKNILKLLDFNKFGDEIFRQWYIDGRLFYQVLIDPGTLTDGIKEVRKISPFKIKPVKEIQRVPYYTRQGTIHLIDDETEYYFYTDEMLRVMGRGLKIAKDTIVFAHSGIINEDKNMIEGQLHVALKPSNQLKMIEDAVVIYRLSRAPERRVFYIDVGTLPKVKAEEYVKSLMNKYKNRITYDPATGATRDETNVMSLQEDFWLPRRQDGKTTEIDTLPAGENLGEIQDIQYFLKKFYRSLNVPISRIEESGSTINFGRAPEIARDELKFAKFVDRLRNRFSELFLSLLRLQLIIKNIIREDEWDDIRQAIWFNYTDDSYFTQLKNAELLKERVAGLQGVNEFVGTYFSKEWVQKNVLHQTDTDIEDMQKQIEKEVKDQTIGADAGTPPGKPPGMVEPPAAPPGQPGFGEDNK